MSEYQGTSCSKQVRYYKFKWLPWDSTHNRLVCIGTFTHIAKLAKWFSCVVSTYLCSAFDCLFLSYHRHVLECIYTLCCLYIKDSALVWSKKVFEIQVTSADCRFTLKSVSDRVRTPNQWNHTDKYSQHR